jgi:hypothetical protein
MRDELKIVQSPTIFTAFTALRDDRLFRAL